MSLSSEIWVIIALLIVSTTAIIIMISAELLHINGRYDERQIHAQKQAGFITMCTLAGLLFIDSIVSRFMPSNKIPDRATTDMLILAIGLCVYVVYITWNDAYFHPQEIRKSSRITAVIMGCYFIFTLARILPPSASSLTQRFFTGLIYATLALTCLSIPLISFIKERKSKQDEINDSEGNEQ